MEPKKIKKKTPIRKTLESIFPIMFLMNIGVYIITLIWGFDLSTLIGLIIGLLYAYFSLWLLGKTVERAVFENPSKAKRMMFTSYALRYALLFLLCWISFELDFIKPIGVLIPQFYARFALIINKMLGKG